ncbi:hypothetical protein GGH19_002307 [Coemansia sp. RSA 1807]|nr:hypothetical protein GGH19_002307 [Coemansia sp. RSA 1807]
MKFYIASVLAFASSAFASLSINSPVAGTVWSNGSPAIVSWISSDGSPLTGTVVVQLMEGSDPNNLALVATIASNVDASAGRVQYLPPASLPGSDYYAVRVTSSVDGPRYSHSFKAGDASVTSPVSSAITVSASSQEPSSEAESTSKESTAVESTTKESTAEESTTEKSSAEPSSTKEEPSSEESETSEEEDSSSELSDLESDSVSDSESTDEDSSDSESQDEDSESQDEDSESQDEDSESSGAAGLSVTLGLLSISAIAALF